jgi:hypothetical protein
MEVNGTDPSPSERIPGNTSRSKGCRHYTYGVKAFNAKKVVTIKANKFKAL